MSKKATVMSDQVGVVDQFWRDRGYCPVVECDDSRSSIQVYLNGEEMDYPERDAICVEIFLESLSWNIEGFPQTKCHGEMSCDGVIDACEQVLEEIRSKAMPALLNFEER